MTTIRKAARNSLRLGAVAALGLGLLSSSAMARELNYAVGLGSNSAPVLAAQDYAAGVMEMSDGDLTIKVFSLELLSLAEMSPGLRDGLTDIGYVVMPYFTSEYAHMNFLAELSMLQTILPSNGKQGLAFAGAMSEYIAFKCPECMDEISAQNQVYMGNVSTPPYLLLCNTEITTLDDLKGKRLRVATPGNKRLAEHFGAVGVQIPVAEAYEALSQGVIDCTMSSAPELTNFRLIEVVSSITKGLPGNVFGASGGGNINRDVWHSLSDDERIVLLRQAASLNAGITWRYHVAAETDMANALDLGKTVIEPDAAVLAAATAFVREDMQLVASLFRENYNIQNAGQMKDEFTKVLSHWSDLVANIDSQEALGELYWSEIFSKLDPATYSMD